MDLRLLSLIFTALIYFLATQMLLGRKEGLTRPMPGWVGYSFAAGGIGLISSLTATGGAALLVAFLTRRGVRIHEAIGTAAAVGWPLAAAGTSGYILSGWGVAQLPDHAFGYVYLPALVGIVLASMVLAPVGARLAHRTPAKALRKIFAFVLFLLATGMLLRFF